MKYTISASNGDSVKIEANNWLVAMGKACHFFQIEPDSIGEWACQSQTDGIFISDAQNDLTWMVRKVAPELTVMAVGPEYDPEEEEEEDFRREETEDFDPSQPPPMLTMPSSQLRKEQKVFSQETLAERLFELSFDITGAAPDEACRIAMGHALDFVECEAANIVRGTLNDQNLVFLSGHGKMGEDLVGREVEYGTGLVGMCHASSMSMHVTQLNEERLAHLPAELHDSIRSVLCVPVVNDDGWIFGVIQLLNVEDELDTAQVDAVAAIGKTLAATLAAEF